MCFNSLQENLELPAYSASALGTLEISLEDSHMSVNYSGR